MESRFGPFGGFTIDLSEKLQLKLVFLFIWDTNKSESGVCKLDILVADVPQANLQENFVFSLSPLRYRVPESSKNYNICWRMYKI